jgi:hypothetical protein
MLPATKSARNKQKLIPNQTHEQSCNSSPLALPEHCALLWIALHQNQPKASSSKTATYRRRDALPILVDQARTQPMPKGQSRDPTLQRAQTCHADNKAAHDKSPLQRSQQLHQSANGWTSQQHTSQSERNTPSKHSVQDYARTKHQLSNAPRGVR